MKTLHSWHNASVALVAALALAACGGGGGDNPIGTPSPAPVVPAPITPAQPANPAPTPAEPGAPALTNDTATDGLNWLNFRRQQAGLSVLTRNSLIDMAATGHSNYQRLNTVTHVQEVGKPGFTGVNLVDRLKAVGYATPSYFYGEVISASSSTSGVYLAEELITAIYHRFAILEPRFKEIGAGAASNSTGYTIFTNNFAANNGYGPGIGKGNIVTWPVTGQTGIVRNFFSDYESPDPVDNANEVGYPISVHADADVVLTVTTFTVKPRGGADLPVKLLSAAADPQKTTTRSAAAIVPLAVLAAATVYDVTFTGMADGAPLAKSWSFTTK
jgi:uncharacterized protein YkwD